MFTNFVLVLASFCLQKLALVMASGSCVYNLDIGTCRMPAQSCQQIKSMNAGAQNKIYFLQDADGNVFQTYCDMITGGGGWTLVASVHENSLAGKCTIGDRWSSEQGNNESHPHGDGNWGNFNTFGGAESATSDDYKSPGYFSMTARDVMIWHVPNDTPVSEYESKAFMKYHTYGSFLSLNGGNLQKLYSEHFPLKDGQFRPFIDNGPAVRVEWDRGSDDIMRENTPKKLISETEPGYIQFRAINEESSALALCPGVKMVNGKANAEHVCIGGTGYHDGHERVEGYCGDFGAKDWDGYASDIGSSANRAMTESVVMVFYR